MQIELRTQCTENRMFITRLKRVLLAENHHCGWNGPTGSQCTHHSGEKGQIKASRRCVTATNVASHPQDRDLVHHQRGLMTILDGADLGAVEGPFASDPWPSRAQGAESSLTTSGGTPRCLAEGHPMRRLLVAMVQRMEALPVPTG